MKLNKDLVVNGINFAKKVIKNEDVQRIMFGEYADGDVRSAADAMKGEYRSPKMKKKHHKKKLKKSKTKFKL